MSAPRVLVVGHPAPLLPGADHAPSPPAVHTHDAYVVAHLRHAERLLRTLPHPAVVLLDAAADPDTERAADTLGVGQYVTTTEPAALERALRCAMARADLARSEERLALALQDGLFDWDLRTGDLHLSARWQELVGEPGQAGDGEPGRWLDRVHPDDRAGLAQALEQCLHASTPHLHHEHRVRHRDGTHRWMLARATVVHDARGRPVRLVGSQADVTERKAAERRLQHDALHDALTGLPNRVLFLDRLDQAIRRARRAAPEEGVSAVLFLDLDSFKLVNDSLGHHAGDDLLRAVAARLEQQLRPPDTVARLGGDEFTVLLSGGITAAAEAEAVAERIHAALGEPLEVHGRSLYVRASVGIALAGRDATPGAVLRDADLAMYEAKKQGSGRHVVFDGRLHARVLRRLDLEAELRRAIEGGGLELAFQPIAQAATGRVAGFEALCRWPGLDVEPAEFLPVAEETGLVVPLGAWVLDAACAQLAAWRATPEGAALHVGVDVSLRQLADPGWTAQLHAALDRHGVPPAALRLEVKEADLARDPRAVLRALEEGGVPAHLDDFGSGQAALRLLHGFPGDAVKLHRGLVGGMGREPGAREVVEALASLAHRLGREVIAEGVRTRSQLDHLRRLGCAFAQGPHVGPPQPAAAATARLGAAPARDGTGVAEAGAQRPVRSSTRPCS